jgi:hypothetical protein
MANGPGDLATRWNCSSGRVWLLDQIEPGEMRKQLDLTTGTEKDRTRLEELLRVYGFVPVLVPVEA